MKKNAITIKFPDGSEYAGMTQFSNIVGRKNMLIPQLTLIIGVSRTT